MKITWDDQDKLYVRVDISGATYQIPTGGNHPDWLDIKAMIEAGTLQIPDYEPLAPSETEGQ